MNQLTKSFDWRLEDLCTLRTYQCERWPMSFSKLNVFVFFHDLFRFLYFSLQNDCCRLQIRNPTIQINWYLELIVIHGSQSRWPDLGNPLKSVMCRLQFWLYSQQTWSDPEAWYLVTRRQGDNQKIKVGLLCFPSWGEYLSPMCRSKAIKNHKETNRQTFFFKSSKNECIIDVMISPLYKRLCLHCVIFISQTKQPAPSH